MPDPAGTPRPVGQEELGAHLEGRIAADNLPRGFEHVTGPLRDDAGELRRSALRAARVKERPPHVP